MKKLNALWNRLKSLSLIRLVPFRFGYPRNISNFKKLLKTFDLEKMIGHASCKIYCMDSNQTYVYCNPKQAIEFGVASKNEVIGKKHSDFIANPDISAMLSRNNQEVMETRNSKIFEETYSRDSDKPITFLSYKRPIFDDGENVIGLFGISIDITEQYIQSEQLKIEKEKTDTLVENLLSHLPGNIWWLDNNNIFLGCNENLAKMYGLKSRYDVVGKDNYAVTLKEHADTYNENNLLVMQSGEEYSMEEKTLLPNGKEATYLVKKAPYRGHSGKIIGTIGLSLDITDRKEMEKNLKIAMDASEAANRAKTEFLEHIRHDVRTPLSGMIGLSELIICETTSEKIRDYSVQLRNSSRELLDFLSDMLESINIKSGQVPLMKKAFNLQSVLEKVIELHRAKAIDKNLNLELIVDPQISANLIGDPVRIYRIILELLGNSLKFTEKGYVKVIAKMVKKVQQDVVVQLEVEDSGPGVPLEKQQELFIRFKNTALSYNGIYRGSGLGLSIVMQFIDDLQAEVGYTDNPTGGARFICIIPFRQSLLDVPIEELPQHNTN